LIVVTRFPDAYIMHWIELRYIVNDPNEVDEL
jgi:hypothetical protein